MIDFSKLHLFIYWAIPLLFGITIHEVAHGWMALRFGDKTAKMLGRLTLNPIKHIDPIGTILLPVVLFLVGGFIFGWAKPVPVTYENLRNPKRDMAFVALAGPATNFIMAILWAFLAKLATLASADLGTLATPLIYMSKVGILVNIILMVLNLLPVPPLDGSRVVSAFLPGKAHFTYSRIEPYGLLILLLLWVTGIIGTVLTPIVNYLFNLISVSLGLP